MLSAVLMVITGMCLAFAFVMLWWAYSTTRGTAITVAVLDRRLRLMAEVQRSALAVALGGPPAPCTLCTDAPPHPRTLCPEWDAFRQAHGLE